jgi:hypothetical protein
VAKEGPSWAGGEETVKTLDPQGEIFQSEFAMVMVGRDESANGARLFIKDMATGNCIYLDPLELEALTRLDHEHFVPLVAPRTREESASRS